MFNTISRNFKQFFLFNNNFFTIFFNNFNIAFFYSK